MRTRLQARGRWGWPVAALEGHSIGRVRPQRDGFRALAHQQDGVVRLLGLFDSRSRALLAVEMANNGCTAFPAEHSRVERIRRP